MLELLEAMADRSRLDGMARYGIVVDKAIGVNMPDIRAFSASVGKDHELAMDLWGTGLHEARIMASLVAEPLELTEDQIERMVADLDSWDLCDQCCSNLFSRTPMAWRKALEWTGRREEFQKRAGFATMAALAVHDRMQDDERFVPFIDAVEREGGDYRKYVRKALSWALRQMGKRSAELNHLCIQAAERMAESGDQNSRSVANDALRELKSEVVRKRLMRNEVR